MSKNNLAIASVLGLVTIILGAFGAHALKDKLDSESMQSFETGVPPKIIANILLHPTFKKIFK